MSDDKAKGVKETIAEEAKGLAKDVYADIGKPILAPVGHVAGGLINLVLWPVKLALDTANAKLGKLSSRVKEKLKAVPPERQLPAPATVAGPAALQYALLGDGDDVSVLREMFEDLLVTSMDRATVSKAHPAFAGMISQMTPDEAWVLKSITKSEYAALHIHDYKGPTGDGYAYGVWSMLGRDSGIDESRLPQYISNLDRLGIVGVDMMAGFSEQDGHEKLYAIVEAGIREPFAAGRLSLTHARVYVTQLGSQFLEACVGVKVPAARYAL